MSMSLLKLGEIIDAIEVECDEEDEKCLVRLNVIDEEGKERTIIIYPYRVVERGKNLLKLKFEMEED